jgi:signal transduction histidine kinase/CheY-like chemotaxis protein
VIPVDRGTTCSECPLKDHTSDCGSVTSRLESGGTLYGFLSVNVSSGIAGDEEAALLVSEISSDIAFALKHIETAENLRGERETLSAIFDGIDDVIYVADPESYELLHVNKAFRSTWGDDVIGKKCYRVLQNMDAPCPFCTNDKIFGDHLGKTFVWEFQNRITKNWYRCADKAIRWRDGRMVRFELAADITENKALQTQLAQADRMSSLGMLAAGVAHEINNPLAYVLYNLESLTDDLTGLPNAMRLYQARLGDRFGTEIVEEAAGDAAVQMNPAFLNDIQDRFRDALDGTLKIRDIARGLGTFSRVERDLLVPVDLIRVIEAALNLCFNEIKYRARVVKDYGRIPTVLASEGRLSQVFLNLFVNAAHAVDEGAVEKNEIRVCTWAENGMVFAEVRDTGKGISGEHLPHLFEPFFTTKEIGVGTGLGLSISKTIVEGYGGRIEVQSEVGKGTSFVLCLPVKNAETADEAGRAARHYPPGLRGRILVVDDEPGIRSAMVRMLRGHEVIDVAPGGEARNLLEADQAFDLILCDMMMPSVSGVELHEWLVVTHPALAKQLVFVTGGAFTPRAREHLQKVDNLRLEKPFDFSNFRKIVNDRILLAQRSKKST